MRRPLLLLILASAACAVAAQVAFAATAAPTSTTAAAAQDEGEVIEVEEAGACEAAAEEVEEVGEGEFEEVDEELEADEECAEEVETSGKSFVAAPPVCLIRRAESKIATLPAADKVRLTLRYRTYEPTQAAIGLKFKDHKGSVTIAHTTRHLGAKGVLHLTAKLGGATMERAQKASEFDVALHAPGTPVHCSRELEQRLHTVKHDGGASRSYAG